MEVAGTDLFGTRLATISVCERGLGEVKAGEGVYGPRPAFMLAGARNLVTSLWQVNDETTNELMAAMYKLIAAGETPPRALPGSAENEFRLRPGHFGGGSLGHARRSSGRVQRDDAHVRARRLAATAKC